MSHRSFALTLAAMLAFAGTGFSNGAVAETPLPPGCTPTGCVGVFGSIYIDPIGVVRLTVPTGMSTASLQCTLYGGQYFSLKRNHAGFKELYAMLLAAQMGSKTLFVRVLENTPDCEVWYAVSYP